MTVSAQQSRSELRPEQNAATTATSTLLTALTPGMQVLVGGNRLVQIPNDLVTRFQPGDRLIAVAEGDAVLHIPQAQHTLVDDAVNRARIAFAALRGMSDKYITLFYDEFAARLADDRVWTRIAEANSADVARAQSAGRSTTRLVASAKMRQAMIDGVREWQEMEPLRGRVLGTLHHDGWQVEQVADSLGVVGFVFEGRPNVFADATGLLRSGNTAVMRIGSDALGTARAIARYALQPSLQEAGLPDGAIVLIDSAERSAGWALFAHPSLSLAVARGSGPAVTQLGAIARQTGTPVSLHGTGGAWIVADALADTGQFRAAIYNSLDRKVCNTVNTICIVAERATELVPVLLEALERAGQRLGYAYKLHVAANSTNVVPDMLFSTKAIMRRASGLSEEPLVEILPAAELGHEWEWEQTPEVSLVVVSSTEEAIRLFNEQSPRFAASLISNDSEAQQRFYAAIDAPFTGNGMTRWVDGQYSLCRPELGLSGWQHGRLLGRSGILSGDSVYTVRLRMTQHNPELHR